MNSLVNTSLAGLLAVVLTLGSIGAIITVPPAQAHSTPVLDTPPLA